MPIDLYYLPGSAPCRAVQITAKAVGVDLNLKLTDLMKGEHLTPEYLKMNPQHVIPTIDDNGLYLWESRAILGYLVDQYGKDDSLYPKDPKKRAVVNQRLFFDIGTLYQRFGDCYYPVMFGGAPLSDEKVKKLEEAFKFLDTFLEKSKFAAGDDITIADHSLVASVSTCEAVGFDVNQYPNVARWYSECKAAITDYQECNGNGAEVFKQMWLSLTSKK